MKKTKLKRCYNILEVANCHSGNYDYLINLIKTFSSLNQNIGIKFQPFYYDEIAAKDFSYYDTYVGLFFKKEQWKKIILLASKSKDVWIDVSGKYSIDIIKDNFSLVKGVKFQSSMLYNEALIEDLAKLDLSKKELLLNVGGLEKKEIDFFLLKLKSKLRPSKIILQVGFQGYPTALSDTGIPKLSYLQNNYKNSLSIADHIDATSPNALLIPNMATLFGVSLIEKHIRLKEETKIDFQSALNFQQFQEFISIQNQILQMANAPFNTEGEKEYLKKSIAVPILKRNLIEGQLVASIDLEFKRTDYPGLNINDLDKKRIEGHVLSRSKKKGSTLVSDNFKKAIVGVLIAGRLKSSRLPNKAILKVNSNLTSIELCQKNCLSIKDVDHVVLATSTDAQDEPLKNHIFPGVKFHRGHPVDVIERYLDVVDQYDIDIIIRITADCPYPSAEALELMLKSHFETGADYTEAAGGALGSLPQIINSEALKRVKKLFGITDYSEYMNGYLIHNPDVFKLNYIDLPEELKSNHRLTLDYENDLDLIKEVENHFSKNNLTYSYKEVIKFLDNNPKVASLNANNSIVYKADPELVEKIRIATTLKK